MAKRKPTIQEMERALGYAVEPAVYVDNVGRRFYSDLTPISDRPYDQTEKEYVNIRRAQRSQDRKEDSSIMLPKCDNTKTISWEGNTVTVRRSDSVGFYKFFVDIQYAFGLDLPFLFTVEEAFGLVSVAHLAQPKILHRPCIEPASQQQLAGSGPQDRSALFILPRELRDKICGFAFHGAEWRSKRRCTGGREYSFCKSVGDLSGFYFPLGNDFALLTVNRQMRQEALPLAYRHTTFYLADIEDLTRFLVAVGRVGRENIESLDFAWESQIDLDYSWRKFPDSETNHLTLPAWHVSHCVQLLKQCRRLKSLCLRFESCLMTDVPLETFRSDPGILSLCSLRGVEDIAILSTDEENMGDYVVARWLRNQMTSKQRTQH